ncbi:helix-turn-helix domain-containing protein [Sporosarcina sp. CAU 1771]
MVLENDVPFYLIQTLQSIRLKNGMRSSDVAEKIGVDTATYEEWEIDSSNISYNYILKIEEVFNIPSKYIYFGKDITLSNYSSE